MHACTQSYLMTRSIDPAFRSRSVARALSAKKQNEHTNPQELSRHYSELIQSTHDWCMSVGMDQGMHNWLVYSGDLELYTASTLFIFKQGEGPVNTLGE